MAGRAGSRSQRRKTAGREIAERESVEREIVERKTGDEKIDRKEEGRAGETNRRPGTG